MQIPYTGKSVDLTLINRKSFEIQEARRAEFISIGSAAQTAVADALAKMTGVRAEDVAKVEETKVDDAEAAAAKKAAFEAKVAAVKAAIEAKKAK